MKTIVIIGGGFSGMMTSIHLLRNTPQPLQVILIEPRDSIGTGIAYSTMHPEHLLNVAVKNMSAFPDDPLHFYRWLHNSGLDFSPDAYVPRMYYRAYLHAIFDEFLNDLNRQHDYTRFEHLTDYVVSVDVQTDYTVVHLESGNALCTDLVVLASGNIRPRNPWVADPIFYQRSLRYVESGWSTDMLVNNLEPGDDVLLIGTSLTMIDHLLTLRERGHDGNIFALSRHGLLPLPHLKHPVEALPFQLDELPEEPHRLLRYIREQAEVVIAAGGEWHSVVNGIRPLVNALWGRAGETERCQFVRHLLPYWNIYRHRIPSQVSEKIDELRTSGQLTVLAGCLDSFEEHADGVYVDIRLRGTDETKRLSVQRVVNCTGVNSDYRTVEQPLIKQLLADGWGRPGPLNIGFDVDENGALIDQDGRASELLFTLGSSRRGQLFESTAVPELREQACALSRHLLAMIEANERILKLSEA